MIIDNTNDIITKEIVEQLINDLIINGFIVPNEMIHFQLEDNK